MTDKKRVIISVEPKQFLTAREVRGAFDYLEEIRRKHDSGQPISLREAEVGAAACAELARTMVAPIIQRLGLMVSNDAYESMPYEERRLKIAEAIEMGLPVLQPQASAELVAALRSLNGSYTAPLLRRKTGRRGAAPDVVVEAELGILKWIEWKIGLGGQDAAVKSEASQITGCEPDAIRKWRTRLSTHYGKTFIDAALSDARQVGLYEATQLADRTDDHGIVESLKRSCELGPDKCACANDPTTWGPPPIRPGSSASFSDEEQALWKAGLSLWRCLASLASLRKRAMKGS
jgi:hypothetical protein